MQPHDTSTSKSGLSKVQRLALSLQFRILAALTNQASLEEAATILERGFTCLYGDVFADIGDETSSGSTESVKEVLEMFKDIYWASKGKPSQELQFRGFCDPPEIHEASFALFCIENLTQFKLLGPLRMANEPMMPIYRKMLEYNRHRRCKSGCTETDLRALEAIATGSLDVTAGGPIN